MSIRSRSALESRNERSRTADGCGPSTSRTAGLASTGPADFIESVQPTNSAGLVPIEAKFLPLLDLSDTVKVTFLDNFPTPLWVLGDTSVYIGQNNINLYGSSEQILANTLCKVVGIRLDTERWMNEFDLEEILL